MTEPTLKMLTCRFCQKSLLYSGDSDIGLLIAMGICHECAEEIPGIKIIEREEDNARAPLEYES